MEVFKVFKKNPIGVNGLLSRLHAIEFFYFFFLFDPVSTLCGAPTLIIPKNISDKDCQLCRLKLLGQTAFTFDIS